MINVINERRVDEREVCMPNDFNRNSMAAACVSEFDVHAIKLKMMRRLFVVESRPRNKQFYLN